MTFDFAGQYNLYDYIKSFDENIFFITISGKVLEIYPVRISIFWKALEYVLVIIL